MKREIKFRYIFQHEETGRMCSIIFNYVQIFNGECKAQYERLTGYFIVSKNQYTGLKDKNGKEIYEGDIIKLGDRNYKIVFSDYTASFMRETRTGYLRYSLNEYECGEYFEIIGNIFENPELLK